LNSVTDLPPLHRAEVAHNLGYAHERLGDVDEAARWYHQALSVNPHLQIAKQALTRIGEAGASAETKESSPSDQPAPARG
jgi:hypothetical protein